MFTAFGLTFFYRIALPGILFTVLMAPLLLRFVIDGARSSGLQVEPTAALVVLAVFAGLVLSGARRPIYYWFEGFAWTPRAEWRRRRLSGKVTKKATRLRELIAKKRRTPSEKQEFRRINEYLAGFPVKVSRTGRPRFWVEQPTRLGNIIASYELYPLTRYGIDATFYWSHIHFKAPEYAQGELERTIAIANGMILASFAGLLAAAVHLVILIARAAGSLVMVMYPVTLPPAAASDQMLLTLGALGIASSILFYALALPSHRVYGRQFKAVVDLTVPDLVALGRQWLPTEAQSAALERRRKFLQHGRPLWPTP